MADPWNRLGGDENDGVPPRPFDRSALEATLAAAVRTADPAAGGPGSDGGVNKAVASLLRAGGVGRIGTAPPATAGGPGSASTAGAPSASTAGGPSGLNGAGAGSASTAGGPGGLSGAGLGGAAGSGSLGGAISAGGPVSTPPTRSGLGGSSSSPGGLTTSVGRIGASSAGLGPAAYAGDNRVSVNGATGRVVSPLSPAPTAVERPIIPLRRPRPAGPVGEEGTSADRAAASGPVTAGDPAARNPAARNPAAGNPAAGEPMTAGEPITAGEPGVSTPDRTAPALTTAAIEPWSPADDDMLPRGPMKKKSLLFFR